MSLQIYSVDNGTIQFVFLGISMFRGPSQSHFKPCLAAWAKMTLSQAQSILPVIINPIVFNY